MAKSNSNTKRGGRAQPVADVPDKVVSKVGKAAAEIMKLRQSFEENMTAAKSEEEMQDLANRVENAAVCAISDQGLTVDQYNEVISAAQADEDLEQRVLVACRAA